MACTLQEGRLKLSGPLHSCLQEKRARKMHESVAPIRGINSAVIAQFTNRSALQLYRDLVLLVMHHSIT